MTAEKAAARRAVEQAGRELVALSHRIHAHPELGFQEERAARWLGEALDDAGLAVEAGICDLPTAFVARIGSGPLHLAVCAEYDCLPQIGHACGHNIIAATAVGVAVALGELVDDLGITLHVIGTPAEEAGNGKALLLERGAFDGVHAAMMVHPAPVDVLVPPLLAFAQFDVRYETATRKHEGHAGRGASPLDAVTVAQAAIGCLRQHLRLTDRVHGIITDGGEAVDVAPQRSTATYLVRARDLAQLEDVRRRVIRCFEAGAVATGATLEIEPAHAPYADMRHDQDLAAHYVRNAEALGRVFPDLGSLLDRGAGSTDMGNISYALPCIHPAIGIDCFPVANHQAEFTAHCVTEAADRALSDGAIGLAWTAVDAAMEAVTRERLLRSRDPTPAVACRVRE
jgi:amidohydrolase